MDDADPPAGGVTGFALKAPEIVETALSVRVTGDAKLFTEVTDTVTVPAEPWAKTKLDELSASEKSPAYSTKPHELARHDPSE